MSARMGAFLEGPAFRRRLDSARSSPRGQLAENPAAVVLAVVRAGYGVALLCTPGRLVRLVSDAEPSRLTWGVARVLGVRHLLQAGVGVAAKRAYPDSPVPLACGAGVDLTHAASMVALGGVSRSARRVALADAVLETALGVVGIVAAGGDRH